VKVAFRRRFDRVVVLMGGPSAEREVSLRSGAAVARGLSQAGYTVTVIDSKGPPVRLPPGTEAVFIAIHGEYGEDGRLQAELNRQGIPYCGPGSNASEASFDKFIAKERLEKARIRTPRWAKVRRGARPPFPLPLVVKPARQGSSIGISRVFRDAEWLPALRTALAHGESFAEEFIHGRELTVGVVGDRILPVIEIVAPGDWYSYENKYTKGACRYDVPASLEPEVDERCRALAWRTFQALGCRGMGRVDLRLAPDGEVFVLELNTIPGFTETSLLPKAASADGIDFAALCHRILDMAATD
jgi:D-alanine-D-alanine ligase